MLLRPQAAWEAWPRGNSWMNSWNLSLSFYSFWGSLEIGGPGGFQAMQLAGHPTDPQVFRTIGGSVGLAMCNDGTGVCHGLCEMGCET